MFEDHLFNGAITSLPRWNVSTAEIKLAAAPRHRPPSLLQFGSLYMFGGEEPQLERAFKAASNELKAASRYFFYFYQHGVPISVPVQTVIDYRGRRLVAMTLLPLNAGANQAECFLSNGELPQLTI